MAGKNQRWFAVEPQLREQLMSARPNFNAALVGPRGIMFPDVIEMGEFGADPAEVIPDTGKDGFDFLRRFFGKCGGQVGAANPLLAHQWSDQPGNTAE